MRLLVITCALLALAACHKAEQNQTVNTRTIPNYAAEPHKGVDRGHKGSPAPAALFDDPSGKPAKIADFAGKPVLINLWATWCAPCVKELPTLQALEKQRKTDLWVVPINQETAPRASIEAFMQAHKLDLPIYRDPKMNVSGALSPDTVLPTSILYDAQGREVWRYVGDLDWTSPEAAKLLAEARAGE